jgi:anaphase-promoting complex subunit 8
MQMPLFALFYYRRAASLKPKDARMWCAVGDTCERLKRIFEAIEAYECAVKLEDPEHTALRRLGAIHYHNLADYDRAEQYYILLSDLDPQNEEARLGLTAIHDMRSRQSERR